MRRLRRLGLWIFAASGMALAVDWLPDALAELEFFRALHRMRSGSWELRDCGS